MCISGNGGDGEYCAFSRLHGREPPIVWWNLWPFPRPRLFRPADVSPRISLCLWTGLVIHWVSGFLLIALWNGSMKITSKNLYVIFTNPVGIQDSQSPTMAPSSLLSNRLKASGKFQLVNTMVDRLAVSCTLRNWAFTTTTADTNPVNDIALLSLVPQSSSFIRPGGAGSPVQRRELAVLPAADPQKKAHHVGLLLPP